MENIDLDLDLDLSEEEEHQLTYLNKLTTTQHLQNERNTLSLKEIFSPPVCFNILFISFSIIIISNKQFQLKRL